MNNLLRKSLLGQIFRQSSLRRTTIRLKAYRSSSRPLPTIPVGKNPIPRNDSHSWTASYD